MSLNKSSLVGYFLIAIAAIALGCVLFFLLDESAVISFGTSLLSAFVLFLIKEAKKINVYITSVDQLPLRYNMMIEMDKIKEKIKILWIDDEFKRGSSENENFSPKVEAKLLQDDGYIITGKKDIGSVHDVKDFHIILCDIGGVGEALKVDTGIDLISSINKQYPFKFVYCITSMQQVPVTAMKVRYEKLIPKIELAGRDLEPKLNEWIQNYITPSYFWENMIEPYFKQEIKMEKSMIKKIKRAYIKDCLASFHDGKKDEKNTALYQLQQKGGDNKDIRFLIEYVTF